MRSSVRERHFHTTRSKEFLFFPRKVVPNGLETVKKYTFFEILKINYARKNVIYLFIIIYIFFKACFSKLIIMDV